jgi:hypothetical protein
MFVSCDGWVGLRICQAWAHPWRKHRRETWCNHSSGKSSNAEYFLMLNRA